MTALINVTLSVSLNVGLSELSHKAALVFVKKSISLQYINNNCSEAA